MAKFKVGDKVRVDIRLADAHKNGRYGIDSKCIWDYNAVRTIEEVCGVSNGITGYTLSIGRGFIWPEYALVSAEPRREFIVIRRSGEKTIAELRYDREVIKSAVATCSEKDTFDFETGAKIAFDRLMGREEAKPAPKAEPELYTGKVKLVKSCGCYECDHIIGKVFEISEGKFTGFVGAWGQPFSSFSDFVSKRHNKNWIEVKD